jgi:hypothetical protein
MFWAVQISTLLTERTAWREAMKTGKKQENAMMLIFEAWPRPNSSRKTG